MDSLLSADEAAARLGTSVRFIRRLVAERRITYTSRGGCTSTPQLGGSPWRSTPGTGRPLRCTGPGRSTPSTRTCATTSSPCSTGAPIVSITRSEVQAFVKGRAQFLAPSTTTTVSAVLRMVMRAAVADRLIGVSPCDRIALPKAAPRRGRPASARGDGRPDRRGAQALPRALPLGGRHGASAGRAARAAAGPGRLLTPARRRGRAADAARTSGRRTSRRRRRPRATGQSQRPTRSSPHSPSTSRASSRRRLVTRRAERAGLRERQGRSDQPDVVSPGCLVAGAGGRRPAEGHAPSTSSATSTPRCSK